VIQFGFHHPRKPERKGNDLKLKKSIETMKEVIKMSQSNDVGSKTREHEMVVSTC